MKKISLILPTYCPDAEVEGYLKDFLKTLEETTPRELYQFIVIENGSYTPILEKKADIYIHKSRPMGYARAVNLGLAISDENLFVIVNNDIKLSPKWLETMIDEYETGTLAPFDRERRQEPGIFEDEHWFSLVMFDRETFEKVGYLDEDINYRFHDQDFSIRVKKAGKPVRRTGDVTVDHINMATFNKMGRPGDERERRIMMDRYGVATFNDWLKL